MKHRLSIYAITLLFSFNATLTIAAEATPELSDAYLAHWFSIDSSEPLNIKLETLENDAIGARSKITFTSDDGQVVNGLIGFPKTKNPDINKAPRLALALHPMGLDQAFWWSENSPLPAYRISNTLRQQGYIVISLDARRHGERGVSSFGTKELIKRAHSTEPRLYIDTIIGSVRDYRTVLKWAKEEFNAEHVLAMGYSMGAQMSLLLASYEPSISNVIAMVPPYVESDTSPVAPRIHTPRIRTTSVLWLAGEKDPHSSKRQTLETFEKITSNEKTITWFDAGHRLPIESIDSVIKYIDSFQTQSYQSQAYESQTPKRSKKASLTEKTEHVSQEGEQ